MKFGKKIYTFQDIEEAKALIGKKVVSGDDFYYISTNPGKYCLVELTGVKEGSYPFVDASGNGFQFIREVIEESSEYRPYNDCTEMIEDFKKRFKSNDVYLIWVRWKNDPQGSLLITGFLDGNAVGIGPERIRLGRLFAEYTYADGTPCGKLVEE